jgi:hypothetical protein
MNLLPITGDRRLAVSPFFDTDVTQATSPHAELIDFSNQSLERFSRSSLSKVLCRSSLSSILPFHCAIQN